MVSIKPTKGLVLCDNIIITKLYGTIRPIVYSVREVVILLSFIVGQNLNDPDINSIPFDIILAYKIYAILRV